MNLSITNCIDCSGSDTIIVLPEVLRLGEFDFMSIVRSPLSRCGRFRNET